MPRLFTGFEIPDRIAENLSMIRSGLSGARWITPDHYHVTLRFIGDIDEVMERDILAILGRIEREPLTLTIDGLSVFGGDRPRALVASLVPTPALMELQAEQERLVRRVGMAPETRKFTPHVTLARLRDTSPYQIAAFIESMGHLPPLRFTADDFVVFSSRASTGGGPYVVEASYPLVEQRIAMATRRTA